MTASSSPATGRFVWYDLITTDIPAATAFYTKVARWGTMDYEMGSAGTYQMWTVGQNPVGGIGALPPEMAGRGIPPHWQATVSVDSVDASVSKAESLGGRVYMPAMDIPTVGRMAVIGDPQGASIGVFTPEQATPRLPFAPQIGEFSWHELLTSDHAAAFSFYSTMFSWEKQGAFDMGAPVGEYLMYGQAGSQPAGAPPAPYGGMFSMTPDMNMPPHWLCYIRVASADDTADVVKSLGGQILNGPMEVPGGDRIAQCLDPQGAAFAVHSTTPA